MIIFTQSGEIEKEVNSPIDIIEVFDSLKEKPLFLNHISSNISYWGQDNPERVSEDEFKYENLAFKLQEAHNVDAWGTAFGPISHILQLDGSFVDNPKFEEITHDAIRYWELRYNHVSNPVIKLQYMGLIYTFKKLITNIDCDNTFLELYARAIIDASKDAYELPLISTSIHLPIAMDIAKQLTFLLPDVKNEFLRHTNNAKDTHIGVWLSYIDYMIKNISDKHLFNTTEKTDLVAIIEHRLSILMNKDPNGDGEEKLNPFDIEKVCLCLAQYYKQVNNRTDKERVIHCIETAFRAIIPQGNPMQQMMWLQEIQKCYFAYGMTNNATALYSEIQSASTSAKSVLELHAEEIVIPKELIDALIVEIINGTPDDIFTHYVEKFTLKHNDATDFVHEQAMNPLANIMGTMILSEKGLPLSKIGIPSYDKEGNEYAFGAKLIDRYAIVMRNVVEILIKKNIFTHESIVTHIMASDLIDADRDFIIKQGVTLYLDKDYITACHILIPQIEHAICNLALKLGIQALRMQPSGNGYMVQLMDKLFDIPEMHDFIGEDKIFYLRTLLTEQRGLNLRNLLCHGLINPIYYDVTKADRIIHTLLLIGGLKKI